MGCLYASKQQTTGRSRPNLTSKRKTRRSAVGKRRSQLAKLASAHKTSRKGQTPRIEDYIEIIYELFRERGYAKPVDISSHLHVTPPTVTIMLERLQKEGLVVHEKYGGIALTERGLDMAKMLGQRHVLLVSFLRLFGVEESNAQRVTEGFEHYVDRETLQILSRFVQYAGSRRDWWEQFRQSQMRKSASSSD